VFSIGAAPRPYNEDFKQVVKLTTVQVSNCRFLGLNKLRHRLLHYPALTDVSVYSSTLCQFVL
jgi:vacuolar-type H+-ATPase catalytic subunit A/Vma1